MRKATFALSFLSLVTSVVTLGVIAIGAKKVHQDIQDMRANTNKALQKMKVALLDVQL
ncbi:membrane protein [Gordonia phage Secretariat]|uniref:Membrane protein n=1 Tax=Gordonia phage Secretariat TaxID=2725616 RepID=A0A6M3T6R2_9CAUD|nr:membrane protein [Gordonia phage Secretariat]QJD49621.1 membrane protein [Gordonia phage Secretariat]